MILRCYLLKLRELRDASFHYHKFYFNQKTIYLTRKCRKNIAMEQNIFNKAIVNYVKNQTIPSCFIFIQSIALVQALQFQIKYMKKVAVPLERDMKKAASSASFDPRKYLKRIKFKKMTSEEALQVEAMAKTVDSGLYEIVKAKISKRPRIWDLMIKTRRCLVAIEQWDKQKNDEQSQNNPNAFDFHNPNNYDKDSLGLDLHNEILQCKDYDDFLQKHKEISRKQLIDHIVKVNYLFRAYQKQESQEESCGEEEILNESSMQSLIQETSFDEEEVDLLIMNGNKEQPTEDITSSDNSLTKPFSYMLKWLPCFSFSFNKSQNKTKIQSEVSQEIYPSKDIKKERGFYYEKNNEY